MKKLNIAATGYYGSTESWKFVKDAYEMIAEAFGNLIHKDDPVILSGVNVSGGNVSAGYITYMGELMEFKSGQKTNIVVIIEEVTETEYNTSPGQGGVLPTYPTYINRYARCGRQGEGIANFYFSDFTKMKDLISVSEATKRATENRKGVAKIARQSDADGDTDDTRIITAKKLANRAATESRKGVAAIATQTEVNAGTDDSKIVTASKLQIKLNELLPDLSGYLEPRHIPAYNAGWAQHLDLPAVYYKDLQGLVHLEGLAVSNSANSQVIFTLPIGYRPSYDRVCPVVVKAGDQWLHSYITIKASGDVTAQAVINIQDSSTIGTVAANFDLVSLDGVFFRV